MRECAAAIVDPSDRPGAGGGLSARARGRVAVRRRVCDAVAGSSSQARGRRQGRWSRSRQRRLYLLRSDRVIAEYPVKLGLNPTGPSSARATSARPRAATGSRAAITRSDFFLSLQVSYPNEADLRARARSSGMRPGGLIMIHGQPNVPRKPPTTTRATTGPTAASPSATPTWSTSGCARRSASRSRSARDEAGRPVRSPRPRTPDSVDARVTPTGSLENLSQHEVDRLLDSSRGGLYPLYRRCSLAVLNARRRDRRRARDLRALRGLRHPHRAPGLGRQARDAATRRRRLRRRADDPRHPGAPVRGAARHPLHPRRGLRARQLRAARVRRASPTPCSTSCATPACCARACGRTSSCAGAGTRSAARNTTTRSRSATSSACAA